MRVSLLLMAAIVHVSGSCASEPYLSPVALAATKDGKNLYVACATANRVLHFDITTRKVLDSIAVPQPPLGLALSSDGKMLYVACAAPESRLCVIDLASNKITATVPAGHTTMSPTLSPDGKTLYLCNRFNNDVSVIDLAAKTERYRIDVDREPVASTITKDEQFLLVANHIQSRRADAAYAAACVSVVDLKAGEVVKEIQLPNGSGGLKDIRISPDGKWAVVTHLVARFNRETGQIMYAWMNANAMTIIDVSKMELHNTVLLDNLDSGAANPWGLAWSPDGATLVVTHDGTHEISIIDFPALIAHVVSLRAMLDPAKATDPNSAFRSQPELADDLPFLAGARERLKLPDTDRGPRAAVIVGNTVIVANYFSDSLTFIDLKKRPLRGESVSLGPKQEMSVVRRGEFLFNDASICLQGWQSCASCHPGDARVDGLNWDLLNDGVGNPKNTKSLLLAHKTPPAMSLGIRDTAETAVRAGIRHILFSKQPEEVAVAIDEYLKSLRPVPSPYLVNGNLSEQAQRGKGVFTRAGCAECHPEGLFTNLRSYDVGTRNSHDKDTDKFDTPTLVEVWRTAPYLHDGSARTIRDVVTIRNPKNEHGTTSSLTAQEVDDLCAFLLSL